MIGARAAMSAAMSWFVSTGPVHGPPAQFGVEPARADGATDLPLPAGARADNPLQSPETAPCRT